MNAPIKVIKNFIQEPEIGLMIEYIDHLEKTHIEKFSVYQDGKRLSLQFGVDPFPYNKSNDLSLLEDKKELITSYFKRVVDTTKKEFDLVQDIYVCFFWLAKQYRGAWHDKHEDTDSGYNPHIKYSGLIYLNTMTRGGELYLEDFGYTYKPEAGDLVLFPSHGTYHQVHEILETRYSLPIWMTDLESMALS
jgi:hypothetical protein